MLIRKKRIRNLSANLPGIQRGESLVFAITNPERHVDRLERIGFTRDLQAGECVLPRATGPVGRFNANGRYIVHKNRPKETAHRQVMWTWTEWHGPNRVERMEARDVPYERYPRTFVPPPSVELTVATNTRDEKLVTSPPFEYTNSNDGSILHVVNLLLELFGECTVLRSNLDEIIRVEVRRLNWEVLPQGRMPWAQLRPHVDPFVRRQRRGNRPLIEQRFQTINDHGPEFLALGRAGFSGYVVFGFPEKDLYVLESVNRDNATYVFEENWQRLSQMTKAEIVDRNLQKERIIHREGWPAEIRRLLT
jgi:hypothetical protein